MLFSFVTNREYYLYDKWILSRDLTAPRFYNYLGGTAVNAMILPVHYHLLVSAIVFRRGRDVRFSIFCPLVTSRHVEPLLYGAYFFLAEDIVPDIDGTYLV